MPVHHKTAGMKSKEYISMVCHELKTPLTSLNAIIQLLDKKIGPNRDQNINESIARADVQIRKMGKLINTFLNDQVMKAGDICLNCERFKLNHLVGEVAEQFRGTSSSHLIIQDCTETILVDADREKLGCVLSNILSNAIKYSPGEKFVYVKCFSTCKNVLVRIRDEGMGIDAKYINRIFDLGFRVYEGNAGKINGLGIGLYLSSLIIKKHSGKIWVESTEGQGSTFYFSLPLHKPEKPGSRPLL